MNPRATWKGYLKLGEVVSAIALHTAVSTSERVSLNMVNRQTGNRLSRRFIDPQTGAEVAREAQVKGYEVASGEYIAFDPEEVAAASPQGDKTLTIESFLACGAVDDLYLDRPYYVRPADEVSQASFALIRQGLRHKKVVALATGVLFRRPRTLLVRAYDEGLIATTLHYDYEVRSAEEAFDGVGSVKIEGEMLDLAKHIIGSKAGAFHPETFDDAYDAALAELVRAKMEGRTIKPLRQPARAKTVDLM
ncbi:MAG: Ku protein, partial [Xanthobacteraceae bacterium]